MAEHPGLTPTAAGQPEQKMPPIIHAPPRSLKI